MSDLLDMAFINSLPQPFLVRDLGSDWWWPVHDIDVETGMFRIDVMGKLQAKHIGDAAEFRDASGDIYRPDEFYSDFDRTALDESASP